MLWSLRKVIKISVFVFISNFSEMFNRWLHLHCMWDIICISFMHRLLPRSCQMMFFSATYEPEVMNFAEIIVSNPLIIRLLREEESLDNIKQYYIKCKNVDEKYTAITNIYGVITIGQAIIFCHVRLIVFYIFIKSYVQFTCK